MSTTTIDHATTTGRAAQVADGPGAQLPLLPVPSCRSCRCSAPDSRCRSRPAARLDT